MKLRKLLYAFSVCLFLFTACDDDNDDLATLPEIKSSGMENNSIKITLGSEVKISPVYNLEDLNYEWKIKDKVISTDAKLNYTPSSYGKFVITLTVKNETGKATCNYNLTVNVKIREITDKSSAYITSLIEYKPAPGQFMNEGGYEDPKQILGKPKYGMLSLGGFGGYISAAFDHTITKRKGKEIVVYGNAFDGSSEPGIVMVSFDTNGNGIADDEWYELAGSEYNAEKTIHNYKITYTNPKKPGVDVPWTDNQGNSGVVKANEYHTSNNYYPKFIDDQESVTFTGTLLENKTDLHYKHPNYGTIVYNPARKWGYTDNYSSEYDNFKGNTFDLDWAVNSKGESIDIPGVDFIKVYTATNVNAGILGENSTEFMGAADMLLLE